ncbi:hypothetical protein [Streptomyces fuscichromogenes]|uniref:hypothetical protein n=1 Tax=Streptomyces fuscichromogenes TaxID=1324013 RepID=UPI001670623E|nr:hypothetical protein [Streptomyces fuscichromogenes]
MGSKYTKRCTEEFKRDAIALVDSSGRTVTAVAREAGISGEGELSDRLAVPGVEGRRWLRSREVARVHLLWSRTQGDC